MTNLQWIRDCWTLFVVDLHRNVIEKDLFGHFSKAGVVFNVFIPRIKVNGRMIGGKKIFVQMAKVTIEALEKLTRIELEGDIGKEMYMHLGLFRSRMWLLHSIFH